MRIFVLAATLGASLLVSIAPAEAQRYGSRRHEVRQEQRECARELRRARNRYEYRREQRECRREIARARAGYRDDDRWDRRDRRYRRY
jgi:hypothetical protein